MMTLTLTFFAFSLLGFLAGYHAGRWAEKRETIETLGELAEAEWRNGYESAMRRRNSGVRYDRLGDEVSDDDGEAPGTVRLWNN